MIFLSPQILRNKNPWAATITIFFFIFYYYLKARSHTGLVKLFYCARKRDNTIIVIERYIPGGFKTNEIITIILLYRQSSLNAIYRRFFFPIINIIIYYYIITAVRLRGARTASVFFFFSLCYILRAPRLSSKVTRFQFFFFPFISIPLVKSHVGVLLNNNNGRCK